MFEEGVNVSFPSWSGYCVWGFQGDTGVEGVKDFVDFLNFIVGRSYVSDPGERY